MRNRRRFALLVSLGMICLCYVVWLWARHPVVREQTVFSACGETYEVHDGFVAFEYGRREKAVGGGPDDWRWHVRSKVVGAEVPPEIADLFEGWPLEMASLEVAQGYRDWLDGWKASLELGQPVHGWSAWPEFAKVTYPNGCIAEIGAESFSEAPIPRNREWSVTVRERRS